MTPLIVLVEQEALQQTAVVRLGPLGSDAERLQSQPYELRRRPHCGAGQKADTLRRLGVPCHLQLVGDRGLSGAYRPGENGKSTLLVGSIAHLRNGNAVLAAGIRKARVWLNGKRGLAQTVKFLVNGDVSLRRAAALA